MRGPLAFVGLALLAALSGCEPSCERTCAKLLDCDGVETPRVGQEDCELQCARQEELYDSWDDTQLQDAFADHKRCVLDETCDAIADGACYDEDLFSY